MRTQPADYEDAIRKVWGSLAPKEPRTKEASCSAGFGLRDRRDVAYAARSRRACKGLRVMVWPGLGATRFTRKLPLGAFGLVGLVALNLFDS